ncbi:MAG: hypothetical protein IJS45_10080 [Clostridia bacterium]|nr:hypothetical protein [Clostridia bacterium]
MRKLVSMLIVVVMVAATVIAAIPVSAATAEVDEVEALYFDVKPNIDGIVSYEEWGDSTVIVDQADAATAGDSRPVNNRFFYRNPGAVPGFDTTTLSMYYEMWLRWDEDYYYVAVKVKDPDGHSLKNGRNNTWNGDGLQFRVDPAGSSADNTSVDPTKDKPWSRGDICDLCFGFVESAGGFTEAWANNLDVGITPFLGGTCNVEVVPAGATYSTDSATGITTYEIAIPWGYIDSVVNHTYEKYNARKKTGGINLAYGMSAVVYNADGNSGANKFNAGLSWGSGIINAQQLEYSATCGGSNKVILSADKVSEDSYYNATHTTGAGYVPPKTTANYPLAIDESVHVGPLTYDSEDDMDSYGLFIDGERVKIDDNWVIRWDEDFPEHSRHPTTSGENDTNYLSTHGTLEDGSDAPYMSNGSYTMEFDIMVTDFRVFEDAYPCVMYNWFGGAKTYEYMCGYNFDTGKFFIEETDSEKIIAEAAGTFTKGVWHHWVFQYFKDNSEMRFYFDPQMENGKVSPSARPMFKMSYRYFDMPGVEKCELIFRRLNCQIMMDNVQFYNFVDFTKTGVKTDETNGNTIVYVETDTEYDVEGTTKENEDGTVSIEVPNNDKYKEDSVTAVKFTLNLKDATDVATFKGIKGLSEEDFEVTENEDGTVTVKVKNLKIFKEAEENKPVFEVILEPAAGVVLTGDKVKETVKVKAVVTNLSASTGDSVILYVGIALAILAVLGTAVVIAVKRKRRIDF